MWNNKLKAVTFSFDDGLMQDRRIIELLDKYGFKGTFNLNSGKFGGGDEFVFNGKKIVRKILTASEIKETYKNHEVAVHTLKHINLTEQTDEEVIRQVEEDRKNLEEVCGYKIVGMAYPCGGVNNDDRVAKIISENSPIRYARTITSTYGFDLQTNLLRFNPSVHIVEEKLEETVKKFIETKTDKPQILYLWGHSYELDMYDDLYERLENCFKALSQEKDIFYGTNTEVLLGKE